MPDLFHANVGRQPVFCWSGKFVTVVREVACSNRELSRCGVLQNQPNVQCLVRSQYDDLARTYEFLTNQLSPIGLVGDANVRLDRPTDPSALRFNDLLESFALRQHVTGATHILGGRLEQSTT